MQTEFFNVFNLYGKEAIAATKELVAINSRLLSKVLESQVSLANLYVEGSEAQIEAAKDFSDLKTFVAKETALVEVYAGKLTEAAQSSVKLAQDTAEEFKGWFEKGLKTADEAVKEVAKAAA